MRRSASASAESPQPMRYVRIHPPTSLCPIFRPLPKGGKRPVLNVSYSAKGSNVVLRFSAREALGIPEQTLLLALLEIARQQYGRDRAQCALSRKSDGETATALWKGLNRGLVDLDGETIRFSTTWMELNQRCGSITGGSGVALRRAQLQRLCEVTVWEETQDARRTTQQSCLVTWLLGDDAKLHLALNVRLATSVLGKPFVLISLAERLSLRSDTAMALHAYYCARVHPTNHLNVSVDTLCQRLWSETDVPGGTLRRRRKSVRDALQELAALPGWEVAQHPSDVVCVKRPELTVRGKSQMA